MGMGGFGGGMGYMPQMQSYQYQQVQYQPSLKWVKQSKHCYYLYRDGALYACWYDNCPKFGGYYERNGDQWGGERYPPWEK